FSPTVREEIAFGPLQMGLPRAEIEQRLCDVADLLGIGGLVDRPPFPPPGGGKKKVAISRTIVIHPDNIPLHEAPHRLELPRPAPRALAGGDVSPPACGGKNLDYGHARPGYRSDHRRPRPRLQRRSYPRRRRAEQGYPRRYRLTAQCQPHP